MYRIPLLKKALLFLVLLAPIIQLFGQDTLFNKKDKFFNDPKLIGFPLVFRTPETGWGGGAGGGLTFRLPGEPENGIRSQIQLSFAYTEFKQILLFFPFRVYWNQSKNQAYGEIGYFDFSDRFYPVGNEFDEEEQQSFEENYRYNYPRIRLNYLRKVSNSSFVGLRYWFDDLTITEKEAGGILETGDLIGTNGGFITGSGLLYQFDTRDNVNYSSEGAYFESVLYWAAPFLGSDFNHRKIYLDYRKFFSLPGKQVLALNAYSRLTFGDVPFDELSLLGGAKRMRGYFEGFYRDKHYGVLQAEYRFPIYKRFSGVAFTSFGAVTDKFSNLKGEYIRLSGGAGLRFVLLPEDKLTLRVDYGLGQNTSGFYLTVGEAF